MPDLSREVDSLRIDYEDSSCDGMCSFVLALRATTHLVCFMERTLNDTLTVVSSHRRGDVSDDFRHTRRASTNQCRELDSR